MYNQPNQNQPRESEAKSLPTRGMSLMEVLASMFVICIGLLGVLAVIPYGAFQVAKAKTAENTSWMLDAAVNDLKVAEMAKPTNWIIEGNLLKSTDGTTNIFLNHLTPASRELNCSHFLMVDPFDTGSTFGSNHIYKIGGNFSGTLGDYRVWQERMRGQDDLVYTTHNDQRTDFSGQGNKILSSGQYTWFFMFRPRPATPPANYNAVAWDDVDPKAPVDVLGCYNRIPGEERTVGVNTWVAFMKGTQIELQDANSEKLDLKTAKYIFVSWWNSNHAEGQWCKVVNAADVIPNGTNFQRTVFVTPNFTPIGTNVQVLIIPGVMYHKQVPDVSVK